MAITAKRMDRKYTYEDYKNWPDDERWEIIDGVAYNMSPAPKVKHQKISGNLYFELKKALRDKKSHCDLFSAPTDVVLDETSVVQPDIFVVCDKNKITEDNIKGAPDLIIEIVSPSTAYKDTKIKKDLYEKFGVKEYIIVFPDLFLVERYVLKDGSYGVPERFNWDETLKLNTFDIEINLWEVFERELPKEEKYEDAKKLEY
ncbi:Uma2 family endonuclease [Hippea sp. KM1]|uniref:Uma2 family endonuclease n=1 Tax=Hippea sp. KM1 TaxID=944481 RepID=UPI00046CA4AD|nr:Uma2 family endonuclease [Hippea sp. KM1]